MYYRKASILRWSSEGKIGYNDKSLEWALYVVLRPLTVAAVVSSPEIATIAFIAALKLEVCRKRTIRILRCPFTIGWLDGKAFEVKEWVDKASDLRKLLPTCLRTRQNRNK